MKLGVLDQSPVLPGETAVDAFEHTIKLAQSAEKLGFARFWVSEHHDTQGLAGSAPEVLLAAVGAHTSSIRIGSAGVLLPHYSPYKVAEQFRVLEALYPGRVDLGIGRAPGGMPLASQALRYGRDKIRDEQFPGALTELAGFLQGNLDPEHRFGSLLTTPVVETAPAIWLLGSSDVSARIASELGAAFSFAHFINGAGGHEAVRAYRRNYTAGPLGSEPRVNVCVTVICADTDEEAERLAVPLDLRLLLFEQGQFRTSFPSYDEAIAYRYTDWDRMRIRENRKRMIVGGPQQVKEQLLLFAEDYGVDELIVVTNTYDFASRIRSYELLAEMFL